MKKVTFVVFVVLGTGLLCQTAFGQAAEIKNIEAYVKTIDARVKRSRGPELVFADTADMEATKEKWEKFASEKALDKHRESSETYSIAYCWRDKGKLAQATFTLFSGSGDWTKYVDHYFRADGTIAKVAIDYRTFYGDVILLQNLYFSSAGKLIKKTNRFLDLRTRKPKKISAEFRESADLMTKEKDYYKTRNRLPFASLLGK